MKYDLIVIGGGGLFWIISSHFGSDSKESRTGYLSASGMSDTAILSGKPPAHRKLCWKT